MNVRLSVLAVVFVGVGCSNQAATEAPVVADAGSDAAVVGFPKIWGPDALEDLNPDPKVVEVRLEAAPTTTVYRDGKSTGVSAFNGSVPGPLLQANVGDEVIVHFTNRQKEATTIHWHGLRISDAMDGSPRIQNPVPPGGEFTYRFRVPDAGTYWYHPHVAANDQVESGLYGPIVIHGKNEPVYDADRYLVIDDVLLDSSGQLEVQDFSSGPNAMHGRYGNVFLTNGRESKTVRVEAKQGQVERWRLVNTANARTMHLGIEGARFRIIGTDGGLLSQPYTTERIELPVGSRFDVEVSYDAPGVAKLVNYIPTQDAKGNVVDDPVMALQVDVAEGSAPREIEWPAIEPLPERAPAKSVTIEFTAVRKGDGKIEWQLNGMAHMHEPLFTFKKGETIRIRMKNKVGPEHPFHLHGQFFTIRDAKRPGLKDVVLVPGLATVEVDAYFDNPGRWMAHCHNLEHSELGMMSEIVVEE